MGTNSDVDKRVDSNSELETVVRKILKHSRYYANSGYLQVLKRSE